MTKIAGKGLFSTLAGTLDAARDDLDQLRDRVSTLKAGLATVHATPDDPVTIEARLDAAIAAAAADRPLHFSGLARPDASDVDLRGFMLRSMSADPFAVFAVLMPETLKAAMLAGMPREGLSPDERVSQRSRIETDLLGAEITEELACRAMEAALGVSVTRRLDAEPAILLAPDASLNGRVRP